MGPLSGIGDSLILGTLRVLAVGIGTSLAVKGNILGPILFFLIFNIPTFILRYVCAIKGYELGANYLEKVQASGLMEKFMLAAAILGVMVIGGMTNELVVAKTALKIGSGKSATQIQSVLDGIMPGLLPLAATGIYYKLLQKKDKCHSYDCWYSYLWYYLCTIWNLSSLKKIFINKKRRKFYV